MVFGCRPRMWRAGVCEAPRRLLPFTFPAFVALQLILMAPAAWGHGDANERIAILDERIESEPNSVPDLLGRSEMHRRQGNHDAAMDDLLRAQSVAPADHRVYYFFGLNYLDTGLFAEAEGALRRYIEAVPASATGRIALARSLSAQQRHLAAAREYELGIAAHPVPVPDHYLERARAYSAAGSAHRGRAIDGLEEAMDELGPLIALRQLAIEIELARGNVAGAIERIDDVLADARRKETWLVRKARILADAGREREARAAFRLARASLNALPRRIRSSPAMVALRKTVSEHLDKDTRR